MISSLRSFCIQPKNIASVGFSYFSTSFRNTFSDTSIMASKPAISMRQKYQQFERQYPDHVVLMQVGDFFEFYGEKAVRQAHAILDLAPNRFGDMTGFPVRSLNAYLTKLLKAGLSVVVAEQYNV